MPNKQPKLFETIIANEPLNTGLIAMQAPVTVHAAETGTGPAKFDVLAYTGDALSLNFYDYPVVVDLGSLKESNSLVANLDHDQSKRVGNVTATENDNSQLKLSGIASAATPHRDEVVNSAKNGFVWQASIEANPGTIEEVSEGTTVTVNGRELTGPLYVARQSTLQGFAFVSHGADDNTTVTIAANRSKPGVKTMDKEIQSFIEGFGLDASSLDDDQVAAFKADFDGRKQKPKPKNTEQLGLEDILASEKENRQRISEITQLTAKYITEYPGSIEAIEALARLAMEGDWEPRRFELEVLRNTRPQAMTVQPTGINSTITNKVLEAAVCQSGRVENLEKHFSDQTLQAAHDHFPHGIGLSQLILLGAEANGYRSQYNSNVTIEAQRAAFGMSAPNRIQAAGGGFSTLTIPDVLSNVANKFLMDGWNAIDLTPLRLSAVRSVRDFKTITTVSLTGDLTFELVGPAGEIKHGDLADETYTNKADTYARMLAITRTDLINDDLGALTTVPRKLGRGSALKLNNIFWTEFLNNSAVFTTARANESTDTGALGALGLEQAETIFLNQTDPDGNPLGIMPAIIVVPTAIKSTALTLMESERRVGGTDPTVPDANIWRGRFRVESSPYMSNSAYTGYSAVAWYMLADPNDLPLIEIVALNGRVEPLVETADADFNVLGIQMRGYSDIGVNIQEYRAGVRANGRLLVSLDPTGTSGNHAAGPVLGNQ